MKPLIGVSILVVVLLVLGSLSNAAAFQTIQNSQQKIFEGDDKTSNTIVNEGLELVDMWLKDDIHDWEITLILKVKNNGTKTIHEIYWYGEWRTIFFHYNDIYHANSVIIHTMEPQETYWFGTFTYPIPYPAPTFLRLTFQIGCDVPDHKDLIIDGKYDLLPLTPLSGGWLWLANLLGR